MRKEIEFTTSSAPVIPTIDRSSGSSFRDITLSPELGKLRIKFPAGKSLVRLLPQIKGAKNATYCEVFNVIKNDSFKAISVPGDLFSRAQSWLWNNAKERLYNYEKNKTGIKLRPQSEAIAWAVTWDDNAQSHLGIIQSAFSAGKNRGLLGDIVAAAEATELDPSTNEESKVFEKSITDEKDGRLITIEKTVDKTVAPQFGTSYTATVSSKAGSDLHKALEHIPDEEYALIRPLDLCLHEPTEEEQLSLLRGYLGAELIGQMGF